MTAADLAGQLNAKRNGQGWTACCLAHPDKTPSLSIAEGRNGGIVLHCFAGCSIDQICAAIGIRTADLMPPTTAPANRPPAKTAPSQPSQKRKTHATPDEAAKAALWEVNQKYKTQDTIFHKVKCWPYQNAAGELCVYIIRFEPEGDPASKTFRPIHKVDNGWQTGDPPGQWQLYMLPEIMKSTEPVFVNEGEGKCDAGRSIGLLCTTSAHGAKSPDKTDWQPLAGRDVFILPDNDEPGRAYGFTVAHLLSELTPPANVKIIQLPGLPEKGDLFDFCELRDGQEPETIRKEILDLVEKAPIWMPAHAGQPPADKSKVYFNAGGKSFLAPDDRGGWIPMSETQVKRSLRNQGVESAILRGEHVSEIDRELLKIQTTQNVDYAGPLAGHRAGVIEIENRRILVTESPRIIEPAPGEWITLKTVMTGLLGDIQLPFLLGWIKVAYEVLRVGKRMPGQALAIAGPRDCGKSLVQNLITPILGGRCARPYQYMTDGSPFNAHLFGAEHLMVEDEVPSTDLRARRAFGAQLKSITVNLEAQCHAKGQTPLMLRPFWRLTITLNDEPENLMVLPPIDESIFDKITLLKGNEQSMPMPTGTITEREAFWAQLISELPAFLAYLIDWQIPADMKSQRFGVTHYHHSDLVFALAELAPEHRLLSLIDGYLFGGMDQWTGTAEELERELTNAKSECRQEAVKLFTFNTAAGTYLGRLAKRYPARFETLRRENHRIWTIKSKECTE